MNESNSRTCASCSGEISADASKCPKCGEWREDIKKERSLCYLFSFLSLIPIIIYFYGKSHRWWAADITAKSSDPFLALANLSKTLDWGAFFSSPSGLMVTALFAITVLLSFKFYISVSKKMHNWIWM